MHSSALAKLRAELPNFPTAELLYKYPEDKNI